MAGLVNIGLQALNVNQQALNTTAQNIANVNVEGYSRQQTVLSTRAAPERGVQLDTIERVADQFATRQLWMDTSASSASDTFLTKASQLDDLLAGSDTGVSTAMDNFFGALQTVVDDPSSIPNREVVMAEAGALVRRFQDLDRLITQQNNDINTQVSGIASQVNSITGEVAQLNEKIRYATSRQEPANELKDQREELVRQLSEMIGVTVQSNGDGEDINLFVGNGQPLVIGNNASQLRIQPGNPSPDAVRVMVDIAGRQVEVGGEIRNGQLGGLLNYREQVLKPAWNELGRLAMVVSSTMNEQHREGIDLDGNLGIDFFKDLSNSTIARSFSTNTMDPAPALKATITEATALKASDYVLTFSAENSFTLVRESDGAKFQLKDFTDVATRTPPANVFADENLTYEADFATGDLKLNIDGFTFELDGTVPFAKGDSYLVQPVRNGAEDIGLNIASGRQLALASPIRGTTAIDNSGTVAIKSIEVTDASDATFTASGGQLTEPVIEVVFNADGTYSVFEYSASDPGNPQPYVRNTTPPQTLTNQPYQNGGAIQLNGFAVTLVNQPEPGDRITFEYNTDGVSDNRNALALSNLQDLKTLDGGTASYQDAYGQLVGRVGTQTRVAQTNASANESVLKATKAIRDGVSGVNLDEEAANIIRFQQAYQAATQLISTSRTLFETLLSVSRG